MGPRKLRARFFTNSDSVRESAVIVGMNLKKPWMLVEWRYIQSWDGKQVFGENANYICWI